MAKITMLKPRLGTASTTKLQTVSAPAWDGAKSSTRLYGRRWREEREVYLQMYPFCVRCKEQGIPTLATDLDHKIPHRGDMALFWDKTNWQGLCKPHHSQKTAKEDGGFGN